MKIYDCTIFFDEKMMFDLRLNNNWLNLWGIESPGLTASLAIGKYVHNIIKFFI